MAETLMAIGVCQFRKPSEAPGVGCFLHNWAFRIHNYLKYIIRRCTMSFYFSALTYPLSTIAVN